MLSGIVLHPLLVNNSVNLGNCFVLLSSTKNLIVTGGVSEFCNGVKVISSNLLLLWISIRNYFLPDLQQNYGNN